MSEHVLIQQQRAILGAFHRALSQYQQQVDQAKERLDNALAQIQATKNNAEQEAKQIYDQAEEHWIRGCMAMISKENQEQFRIRLTTSLAMLKGQTYAPIPTNDTNLIKNRMTMIGQEQVKTPKDMTWLYVGGCIVFLVSFIVFPINLLLLYLWKPLATNIILSYAQEQIARLIPLYRRWLELIAEQAQAQEAQACQAYQQAMAQAEAQLNAAREQFKSAAAEYTRLVEQTSPSWQDPAWQDWQPAASITGVVRLGIFKEVTNARPRLVEVVSVGTLMPVSLLLENKEK